MRPLRIRRQHQRSLIEQQKEIVADSREVRVAIGTANFLVVLAVFGAKVRPAKLGRKDEAIHTSSTPC